jgi:serine/threonine kinase 3
VKNPDDRSSASDMLEHEFIKNAAPVTVLEEAIHESISIQEESIKKQTVKNSRFDEEIDSGTLIPGGTSSDDGTLVARHGQFLTAQSSDVDIVDNARQNLNTLTLNEDEATMKRYATNESSTIKSGDPSSDNKPYFMQQLAKMSEAAQTADSTTSSSSMSAIKDSNAPGRFMRSFDDGDFDFIKHLTTEELHQRLSVLELEMDREIDDLKRRYQTKRQPILDAMDQKKQRMTNF